MRVIAIGDVVGRPGRQALEHFLPKIREQFQPDLVIINGENLAGGFGITIKIHDRLMNESMISCITMGNHWADKREVYQILAGPNVLVIPRNAHNVTESVHSGYRIIETPAGTVAVMNVIGNAFMHQDNRCPFQAIDEIMMRIPDQVKMRIVDVHAEATSEKQGLAWYLAGKVSLVYGTHSHVPTMDQRILLNHTAFVTDIGMTGPYESVIGMKTPLALKRLREKQKVIFEPAKNDLRLSFVACQMNPQTGAASNIQRFLWSLDPLENQFIKC